MTIEISPVSDPAARTKGQLALNAKARSGTAWIMFGFGFGQVIRLAMNIVLAALLFEEAFALMALVSAVLMGLAMFSDIGLQQNVVQNPRGDEPDFLNTAWTMQVIRGVVLTLIATLLAWPLALFYAGNDPAALELRWLIPLVALTALFDGLRSPRTLSAARHMRVAQLTRIELGVALVNSVVMVGLAWYTRSVYALAVAAVISSALFAALTYLMLPGPRGRFVLEPTAVRSIFSLGKWIFLSTLIYFLAMQIDRLSFAAMYPLAEVGVYSISASLALVVSNLVGRLQGAIVFPWYARMIDQDIGLTVAFHKAKAPVLVMATFLVVMLIAGAGSFFELAYDSRYSQAAVFLPILALGVWLSNIGAMYGSAFLVKGQAKWLALVSAVKVLSFLVFLAFLANIQSTLVMGSIAVLCSEAAAACMSLYLGRRLGLRDLKVEAAMLATLIFCSGAGLLMVHGFGPVVRLPPAVQLLVLGVLITILFTPLFFKFIYPLLRQRAA